MSPKADLGRSRTDLGLIVLVGAALPPSFPPSERTSPLEGWHSSLRKHQVLQPEQRVELRFVLGNAAVAHLAMAEEVLDHMEGMLATRPHFRLRRLSGFTHPIQTAFRERPALAPIHGNVPVHVSANRLGGLVRALLTRVAKGVFFGTVDQVMRLGDVGHVGRRALQRVNEPLWASRPTCVFKPK